MAALTDAPSPPFHACLPSAADATFPPHAAPPASFDSNRRIFSAAGAPLSVSVKLRNFFQPGEVLRDADFSVTLHPRAATPGAICYALTEAALLRVNRNPNLSAVITTPALAGQVSEEKGVATVENPQESYYRLHNHLFQAGLMEPHANHFIDPSAEIAPTAVLGRKLQIGAGVKIGFGAVIHDYTILGEGTFIGDYVVLGGRGMQNTKVDGRRFKVEWAGGVKIGRDCEILTAAIVQRPYHCEYTEIGDETQAAGKASIGHGAKIGPRAMIGGNAQIAGNVHIGQDVWIGQASTLSDGLEIGDRAQVKMGSVVVRNVPADAAVSGNFAIPHERNIQEFIRKNA